MNPHAHAVELARELRSLQQELRAHFKLDVRKHYSLMVASAAANSALARWEKHESLTAGFGESRRDPETGELL